MSISPRKAVVGAGFTLLILGVAAPVGFWYLSLALDRALNLGPFLSLPLSLILAATAILIGVFWMSWAYSYLVFLGKGLPLEAFGRALHPTRYLVTTGPYAYSRNPMVIGFLFVILGVALLRGSISGVVLVPIIAGLAAFYLVEFEEKHLVRRFGADYEEYRRNVPLLIPRLNPYAHKPAVSA